MKIADLVMTKAEAEKDMGITPEGKPDPAELPRYPYGTCLYLDSDTIKKLGIAGDEDGGGMPKVGTEFVIVGRARVKGTSQRESQDGTYASLDLQLVKLGIEPAPQGETLAQKAYSKPTLPKTAQGGYAS